MLKMTKDYALYRHGGCRYCPTAKYSCHQSQSETADAAKPIAFAAMSISSLKFRPEYGTVLLLMRLELVELSDNGWCCDSSQENLASVNIYGPMLSSVIDL